MKPRYRLVMATYAWLLFENVTYQGFGREQYLLDRWRWNCMQQGYWPGAPA